MGVTGIQQGGMVLPYLWASLTLALLARGASQEGYDNLEKDVRFLGKRARQAGFSSWAGKRSGRNQQQAFSSWAGKRAPFNSWAGKRSSEEDLITEPEYVRRKRSSDDV